MKESAIFGPRIEAVEDDAFLAGVDEIFGFSNGLTCYPVMTFGFADHFAKGFFAFAISGALNTAFFHFAVNHVAKMNFGKALRGEKIDGDGFAATAHANDGEDFEVVVFHDDYYSMTITSPYVSLTNTASCHPAVAGATRLVLGRSLRNVCKRHIGRGNPPTTYTLTS